MKKPKLVCITCTLIKHCGHLKTLEQSRKHSHVSRVFYCTFPLCSQICAMFYNSVLHGLHVGFFIC